METKDIILLIFGAVSGISLYFAARSPFFGRSPKLRVLFLAPLIAAIFHMDICGAQRALIGVYAGCALIAVMAIAEKGRSAILGASLAAMVSALVLCPLDSDYRSAGFARDFESCFRQMKAEYVLTDHKGIDWDELHDRYLPMFQEADRTNDIDLCYEAGTRFAMEFHDGHVSFNYGADERIIKELNERYDRAHCGNDYGFSLIRLTDGRTVFVNVGEGSSAYASGIRDGMEITAIDGEDIDSLTESADIWFNSFPDIENARFYAPLAATSAKTGDIEVEFTDNSGKRRSAVIPPDGSYYERFRRTLDILNGERETTNFASFMADENTGCLVLNGMTQDTYIIASEEARAWAESEGYDLNKINYEPYGNMKLQVGYELSELKKQGAEDLIIDLRNNRGGQLDMVTAMASLFCSEELFIANGGEFLPDGSLGIYDTLKASPENKWGDGRIVILVNSNTASAGELFSRSIGQLSNATVMGLTKTCGCAQATFGYVSGDMTISGSRMLMLDENGEILIDSGKDRLNRYIPDILLPLDEEAVRRIFTEGEDYVLDCAKKYLNENS